MQGRFMGVATKLLSARQQMFGGCVDTVMIHDGVNVRHARQRRCCVSSFPAPSQAPNPTDGVSMTGPPYIPQPSRLKGVGGCLPFTRLKTNRRGLNLKILKILVVALWTAACPGLANLPQGAGLDYGGEMRSLTAVGLLAWCKPRPFDGARAGRGREGVEHPGRKHRAGLPAHVAL